jgi:hypothetical protein
MQLKSGMLWDGPTDPILKNLANSIRMNGFCSRYTTNVSYLAEVE